MPAILNLTTGIVYLAGGIPFGGSPQVVGDVLSINVTGLPTSARGENIFGTVSTDGTPAFRIRVDSTNSGTVGLLTNAANLTLDGGYTASGRAQVLRITNNAATPGTQPFSANQSGSEGIYSLVQGAGTLNTSGYFESGFSTAVNLGLIGAATNPASAAVQGIGVWGTSIDESAKGNIRVGGLFDLQAGGGNAPTETVSAALIADNRALAAAIFIARDNGTAVFTIADGGAVTMTAGITTGSTTLHSTSVALTNNAAAQLATITNSPTAGNPTKWIPINDNGTTRNIPVW